MTQILVLALIALIKFQYYGEKKKTYDWKGEV